MDLPQLREVTPESIAESTWVIRKRMGEPGILLPPHDRYWKKIGKERGALFEENLKWLRQNHDIFQKIVTYYREYRYPFIPHLDPDASLYQIGFYSRADESLCRKFHRVSLEDKAALIDQFTSPDARTLASRIICRNYPAAMSAKYAADFKSYMARINPTNEADAMVDYREKRRTTPIGALNEIKRLKQNGELTGPQSTLLTDLEDYLRMKFKIQDTDKHKF
jgi:exodeoxyribonuclease-1